MALTSRSRRRLRNIVTAVAAAFLILWCLVPYDSPIRLSVLFNIDRAFASYQNRHEDWSWVDGPQIHPVDLAKDVVVIVKTGFGTKDRAKAWLEVVDNEGQDGMGIFENVFVVADFASKDGEHFTYRGQPVAVQDSVARTLAAVPQEHLSRSDRPEKHSKLIAAIDNAPNVEEAMTLSKKFGWELDAMKFVSALEDVFQKLPSKKWYLLIDDDTYLVQSSLSSILGQLDSSKPHFLGNAVGSFKTRFGHGGSGLVFSRAALEKLYRPGHAHGEVARAHAESLTETWGDRLIARALLRVNVRLDERRQLFFNGEPPALTHMRPDRFCAPIASFHHLSTADLQQASEAVRRKGSSSPIRWLEVWDMFSRVSLDAFEKEPVRLGWDHVGTADFDARGAAGEVHMIETAERCRKACEAEKGGRGCLAWNWDGRGRCRFGQWMVPGTSKGNEGISTGINVKRAKELAARCT